MKKILVIDDNHDILELMDLIFSSEGFDVETLDNGKEVSACINSSRPDLIILDVMLKGLDGRDICNQLKGDRDTSGIPILMLSASHTKNSTDKKICAADGFMGKPFDLTELLTEVNRHWLAE
jgi:DNA-binding response OmpR family regulator